MRADEIRRLAAFGNSRILYLTVCVMKPVQPVEWRETEPGIWTPIPDDEMGARKGPARRIASMTAERPAGLLAREGKSSKGGVVRARMGKRAGA